MTKRWLALFVLIAACVSSGGKVRSGQQYSTGLLKYDDYFKQVHLLQLEGANWDDDKHASRRPLVDALKLDPNAADVSIIQGTHERMISAAHEVGATRLDLREGDIHVAVPNESRMSASTKELFRAVEAAVKAELDRAKSLRTLPPKVDGLTRTAHELDPLIDGDFAKRSRTLANEVHEELASSIEVLSGLSAGSRNAAREAEDFVADLQRAVIAEPSDPLPTADGSPIVTSSAKATPAPTPKPKPHPQPKPADTTPTNPNPTPKPKPKPQPPPDEVFNP
jgi:hypothetical protein